MSATFSDRFRMPNEKIAKEWYCVIIQGRSHPVKARLCSLRGEICGGILNDAESLVGMLRQKFLLRHPESVRQLDKKSATENTKQITVLISYQIREGHPIRIRNEEFKQIKLKLS